MKVIFLFFTAVAFLHTASNAQVILANPAVTNNKAAELKTPAEKTVAFRLSPFSNSVTLPANVASATGTDLNLTIKEFDLGNNISGNSFIASETGIYHFDVRLNINFPITDYQDYLRFYLMLNKNGSTIEKTILMNPQTDKSPMHTLSISTTIYLSKGDRITASYNADANSADKYASASEVSFSGFKVSGMTGVATGAGTIK